MTTLADIRTRVRKDLHDIDSGAYRWTDSEIDRHIGRALDELSLAIPQEKSSTVATTAGSRDVSLASISGVIDVEAIEFPAGEFPPAYVGFSRWANTITLHGEREPDGENAKLYYTARHTLDDTGTTLPGHLEELLTTGAGAYAALEWSSFATDRLNMGGPGVADQYAAWARARLTAFRQLLFQQSRANRVRGRRLYTPA
jgi:hypothetical protein